MSNGIDHVLIYVNDLAAATGEFAAAGFTVTPGGQHANRLTHNALICFADGAYLELIAYIDPNNPANDGYLSRRGAGEGYIGFALRGDQLIEVAAAARARGLEISDPVENGRQRPDGIELRWRAVQVKTESEQLPVPFVIEDLTPRERRVPSGPATQHRLPVTRLAGATVRAADFDRVSQIYAGLLGVAGVTANPSDGSAGRARRFSVGPHWIELIETATAADATRRGGVSELVLASDAAAEPGAGRLLPPERVRGARIRLA